MEMIFISKLIQEHLWKGRKVYKVSKKKTPQDEFEQAIKELEQINKEKQ